VVRKLIKQLTRGLALRLVNTRYHAALITWMARTGEGTDATLRMGSLPLPVHFYSPVPDLEDLGRRGVWDRRSELPGIDFRPEVQLEYLQLLGREFGLECDWPPTATNDPAQFYTENNSFSFGCAAAAHSVIRQRKTRRVIEAGSGMSSLVISSALRRNEAEGVADPAYTVVDPYPSPKLDMLRGVSATVIPRRIEEMGTDLFDELGRGDVLFIDSGHTVRIGGDVNFLVLEILPRLKPGVLVHLHDIDLPYEYPEVYLRNPAFRMLWTEAYLLQAFLAHNSAFEILLGMRYLMRDHPETFGQAFPKFDRTRHKLTSGSFWIARR
jgi:methyltransferase family protein